MFRVELRPLLRNKLHICKDYHIQPSEIDRMPYYEYECLLEDINAYVKEEEERQKKEQESYNEQRNSFKMPSMNSIKPPSFTMPKI